MQVQGLEPNVLVYSALVSAREKGPKGSKPFRPLELSPVTRGPGLVPHVISSGAWVSARAKGQTGSTV